MLKWFQILPNTKKRNDTNAVQCLPEKRSRFPNSFYKVSITLIPKSNKDIRKENYESLFLINTDAKTSTRYKRIIHPGEKKEL